MVQGAAHQGSRPAEVTPQVQMTGKEVAELAHSTIRVLGVAGQPEVGPVGALPAVASPDRGQPRAAAGAAELVSAVRRSFPAAVGSSPAAAGSWASAISARRPLASPAPATTPPGGPCRVVGHHRLPCVEAGGTAGCPLRPGSCPRQDTCRPCRTPGPTSWADQGGIGRREHRPEVRWARCGWAGSRGRPPAQGSAEPAGRPPSREWAAARLAGGAAARLLGWDG